MKPPIDSSTASEPGDLAASWFAYLHSGEATDEGRRMFEQWRQAHPEHDRQYRSVQQIWEATLAIPEAELRSVLAQREPAVLPTRVSTAAPTAVPTNSGRRRLVWGLAGACSAALVGGIALQGGWLASPQHTIQIATPRGKRQQVTLPDGSILDVNTGTRAVARMYADKRVIELQEGEIFFAVRHDAQQPFIVDAGASRVVVTGTRFNVRHDADAARISVESGSVVVSSGPWWQRQSRALTKGQGVDVSADQTLGEVRPHDLHSLLAWQRGKVVFENTPLAQAVAEINRYLDQPARLDAPALRDHRIAGIFSVDDPEALIDMLPEFVPVRVYRLLDGQIRIVAK
ncbi:DUF4880 domain-containing protein [Pigmentiphaga aceris]|uniref:DUF4880 domain-containing protein n=1 Tax=Pigmentiphaga aceris TaxID=1940612 RepID=A0A5C0AZF5_9BURK|nr:FecR domain-containing protein [Pigmentiphaga aceris]QEI07565.1 DUF4880 domain-containing protein [Pigmentiphaga aceris]